MAAPDPRNAGLLEFPRLTAEDDVIYSVLRRKLTPEVMVNGLPSWFNGRSRSRSFGCNGAGLSEKWIAMEVRKWVMSNVTD